MFLLTPKVPPSLSFRAEDFKVREFWSTATMITERRKGIVRICVFLLGLNPLFCFLFLNIFFF